MFSRSLVPLGYLAALLGVAEGGCLCTVSWQVTQTAGGTCPGEFTGAGGEAYDWMVHEVFNSRRRRLSVDESCNPAYGSPAASNCAPIAGGGDNFPKGIRRLNDGCDQCTGADDDSDDITYDLDDDDGDGRRLDIWGGMESMLTYTVTADVPDGEDPIAVMADVERDLNEFFQDEENARITWITKARELGSNMSLDTQMAFLPTVVDTETIVVAGPEETADDDDDDQKVHIGVWIGVGVAGLVGLLVSAKYGIKAYRKDSGVNAAVEQENEGGIAMNPLSSSIQQENN